MDQQKRIFGKDISNIYQLNNVFQKEMFKNNNLNINKNIFSQININNINEDIYLPLKKKSKEEESKNNSPIFLKTHYQKIFPVNYYNPPEIEYIDDILNSLNIEEINHEYLKSIDFMSIQNGFLTPFIRANMIKTMYIIQKLLQLSDKTIFLAIQILDHLFCLTQINNKLYKLIITGVLLISTKFQEITYPDFHDWLHVTNDCSVTKNDIIKIERDISNTINYDLLPLYPMLFFEIIEKKANLNKKEFYLGCYIIEACQFDYALYKYKNIVFIQAVLFLIFKICRKKEQIKAEDYLNQIFKNNDFNKRNDYNLNVCNFINIFCFIIYNINNNLFKDLKEKYLKKEFCSVADFNNFP